ncbi:MAG: DinB family protein [Anaerolineae bacterium]
MSVEAREQLIADLGRYRQQMSALLLTVTEDQDWQPDLDNWSFRYVAAHMAVCDSECLQPRIKQIAAGENPTFELYFNTGRDFSGFELKQSLKDWEQIRQEIIEFYRALPEEKLTLTGNHQSYGVITVADYLRIMVDHDREHVQELEEMLARYEQRK